MSIYNRDNINYSGMIANMLAAKQRGIEAEKANTLAQGQIWSDLVNKLGGMAGRYVASRQVDEDEELLKKLEQERQQLIDQQKAIDTAKMQDYRTLPDMTYNQALMNGYRPNVIEQPRVQQTGNVYALPGDSNSTQSDYVKYLQAMNKLYGGF
jgi:hypothetical protein